MASRHPSARLRLAATCSRGFEEVLAAEVGAAGGTAVEPGRGVVRFAGDERTLLRANVCLRTAMRVLVELGGGRVGDRHDLYALAAGVPWERWLEGTMTFAVAAVGRHEAFGNTTFAALTVKDAVADRLRRLRGHRPDVDRHDPDLRIHLHLGDGRADLALDASGEPLAHRGYRPRGGPAPLAETTAAGLLLLAGYDGTAPFLDPLAGTGTIAIEAALLACRRAPGLVRRFACERWPGHDARVTDEIRAAARADVVPPAATIVASDRDPRAVAAIVANAAAAGVGGAVAVRRSDVRDLPVQADGTFVLCNPPYGQRLGEVGELRELYRALGDSFKRVLPGGVAWVLSGAPELVKAVGLRATRRIVVFNGPIECRLVRFDIVAGRFGAGGDGGTATQPDDRLSDP